LRIVGKRVLRTFGPKGDEMVGDWRELQNAELNILCSSPDTIRMIKSRRRWTGHVANMGENRNAYRVLMVKERRKKERDQ
jgi:hypothetical protein